MLKISGPVGAALFVATILVSGAGTGISIDSARADACLAAPKTAAPGGQHWYFHVDRATRRKCWYLHAAGQLRHRAALRHHAVAAADAEAEPAPETQIAAAPAAALAAPAPPAAMPAPMPGNGAGDTPPAPHVTVLAVKTATPFVDTTVLPQHNTSEKPPAPPLPQTLPRDADTPVTATTGPAATGPADNADRHEPQGKADAAYDAPAQAADAARMRTAQEFILLALVLGLAAALTAIVSKIVGIYRRPRISDDPDAAWLTYRSTRRLEAETGRGEQDVPFVDPQDHYGLADLHAQEWLDRSAPAQSQTSTAPPRIADFTQPDSPRAGLTDIELALRALRQARQGAGRAAARRSGSRAVGDCFPAGSLKSATEPESNPFK